MREKLPRPFDGDPRVDPNCLEMDLSAGTQKLVEGLSNPKNLTVEKAVELFSAGILKCKTCDSLNPLYESGYLIECASFIIENLQLMEKITPQELERFTVFATSMLEADDKIN